MKYADEMRMGTVIYIPSFIMTSLGIEKLMRGIHTDTQSAW
jgi:hypothetical protein